MSSGKFKVVYEDNHLLVVDKAPGVLVQGDQTGDAVLGDYVKDYLREKYNKPGNIFLGVVHRLDRPVSGLVLLAKTSKALERMNKLFRERDIEKVYIAIVEGRPAQHSGKLIHWLQKNQEKNIVKAFQSQKGDAQRSELDYEMLESKGEHSLLEVHPLTGRPHQIRVQLSTMGCPIKGDLKYGYPAPNKQGNICLHALRLKFIHPVQKTEITVESEYPDWSGWELFKK